MTLPVKAITFSLPLLAIAGTTYYSYDVYWPKTIEDWFKMDGIEPINLTSQPNHWRAMFNDYRDAVDELEVDGLTPTTSEDLALPLLKNWCQTNLKKPWSKELKEKMFRHCIYKPRTVKGWIIGSGKYENFITEDEDYEMVFAIYRENSTNGGDRSKKDSDTIEIFEGELKGWCETELNTEIEKSMFKDGNYSIIFTICRKLGYRTVKEKINKTNPGWRMMESENVEKWENAFERWKYTSFVLGAINKGEANPLTPSTPKTEGGPKMKNWCERGMDKKLSDDYVYPQEYILLISACREI